MNLPPLLQSFLRKDLRDYSTTIDRGREKCPIIFADVSKSKATSGVEKSTSAIARVLFS
jgi:hypothetical protein